MFAARLLTAVLVSLALVPAAQAESHASRLAAPTGLSAFAKYPGDTPMRVFSRTPAFAWKPVAGAARYELVLSTSSLSATSGIIWDDATLKSPAAAVAIALPWITGNPYSLYARVRAITAGGSVGKWSKGYGFTMRWPDVPQQLSAPAGLLRWSTVDGASAYDVAFENMDVNNTRKSKIVRTTTNVMDEREYYTFHQTPRFTGTVLWRVRAVRQVYGAAANGLPATTYGPWSPEYTSINPTFTSGPLANLKAISDSTSTQTKPTAHHLMPAFAWSGDTGESGYADELYRVYVFTDRDCLNVVFKSAIVGSPAYAPRSQGALDLPTDASGIVDFRKKFLPNGKQPASFTKDGQDATPTEDLDPSVFTPQVSGGTTGTGPTGTGSTGTGSTGTGSTDTGAATGGDPSTQSGKTSSSFTFPTSITAATSPIDLWDTDWPSSRYYWTVVPVFELMPDVTTTWVASSTVAGAPALAVTDVSDFKVGDLLQVGLGPDLETAKVKSIAGQSLTLENPLVLSHTAGEEVARMTGSVEYYDDELAQDACASGRVASFGRVSEPSLTSANGRVPYAAGLSPSGRFVAASRPRPTFYGAPLVSWAPAQGATAYEVQWSKSSYPWHAAADPLYTFSTSASLPVKPGTWYYRVRGIDLALPTGAQQMAWSNPVPLVVAKPRFSVVSGS